MKKETKYKEKKQNRGLTWLLTQKKGKKQKEKRTYKNQKKETEQGYSKEKVPLKK